MVKRIAVALLLVFPCGVSIAQTYPSKPIRWIAPFPPGGPVDLLARTVGQKLSESWSPPVIVDNRAGAVDAQSVRDLVKLAKANPGKLTFASPGAGAQAHLAGELVKLTAGIDMVHVPYKRTGPALNDLLGGQVSMMFSQLSSALPHVRSGKLRAIGLASLKRSLIMPDLPTIAEQCFPGFEAVSWYALMVPTGTPQDVIAKLHAETSRILKLPEVRDKLAGLGAEPVGNLPEELAATIRSESARWSDVIRQQGIKAD